MTDALRNDVNLFYELGQLGQLQRTYLYTNSAPTVAAHSHRVAIVALMLARQEGANVEKTLLMALMHDVTEVRTGDPTPFQKSFIKKDDHLAASSQFGETTLADMVDLLTEYEQRECLEAKIVKDADMLVAELEMCELTARGHQYPTAFLAERDTVLPRLRTATAKQLFTLIRETSPFEWIRKGPNAYKDGKMGL